MQTGGELAGLAVVNRADGQRLGRIHDIVFESASGRIVGIIVDPGGLFARNKYLPAGLVHNLGADALIVTAEELQDEGKDSLRPGDIAAKSLDGRPVLNEAGTVLGKVADVVVSPEAMTISALVLSTGLIDNALHGKPQLPIGVVKAFGDASILVPASYDPKSEA